MLDLMVERAAGALVRPVPHAELTPQLGEQELLSQLETSAHVLYNQQHPYSHLFPASAKERYDASGHYSHSWVRDNAMIGMALSDPAVLDLYPKTTKMGKDIRTLGSRLTLGMLKLFSKEPWSSAFEQKVEEREDSDGQTYTHLTRSAPPVHFDVDGRNCDWPTQNQPDSWGEFLIATGQAVRQDIIKLDSKQQVVIDRIVDYLLRVKVDRLKQSSMWEWGEVYSPPPLSTLALCAMGLKHSLSLVSPHLKEPIRRTVRRLQEGIEHGYPVEYTVPQGHSGKADLATLVALSLGALDGFSSSKYFIIANPELGNGDYPGKKRYLGDHYQRTGEEPIWPMGAVLEANVFLGKAIINSGDIARKYKEIGLNSLRKAKAVYDRYGYIPELLQIHKGALVPNNNHLLWNEALMAQACSKALLATGLS